MIVDTSRFSIGLPRNTQPYAIEFPVAFGTAEVSPLRLSASVRYRSLNGGGDAVEAQLSCCSDLRVQADGAVEVLLSGHSLQATVQMREAGSSILLDLSVLLAEGGQGLRLLDWVWKFEGVPDSLKRVWHMTFNCWGVPGIIGRDEFAAGAEHPPVNRLAILSPDSQKGYIFSYKLPTDWVHVAQGADDGSWTFTTQIDADLKPGESWTNETLFLGIGYAAKKLGGVPDFTVSRHTREQVVNHVAWNSWDYYKLEVTAEDIRSNIRAIQADPVLSKAIKYIIIDDGWQTLDGYWEANEKFPEGMAALAAEIRAAGFIPGIWTAPFIVNSRTSIYRDHPDWFVQDDGKPMSMFASIGCKGVWGERYFLDPSHPAVSVYLEKLYSKIRGWGFGYFKTDFLTNTFTPRIKMMLPDRGVICKYFDHSQGVLKPHRKCMEVMRKAMGEESFWLGCGSIWATGAGIMDASRTSGDIAPHWQDLKKCAKTAFFNGHAHGRVFLNDPDFLVIRGKETNDPALLDLSDEEIVTATPGKHRTGPMFNANEARMWASLVLLSGGSITLSDRMDAMNDCGRDILHRFFAVAQRSNCAPAFPLDMNQELPTSALRKEFGRETGDELLGLFNWDEEAQHPLTVALPEALQQARWRDVWTDREWTGAGLASLELAPHSCVLLERI